MAEQRAFNPLVQGSTPWGRTCVREVQSRLFAATDFMCLQMSYKTGSNLGLSFIGVERARSIGSSAAPGSREILTS